jgi:hypothetical protein
MHVVQGTVFMHLVQGREIILAGRPCHQTVQALWIIHVNEHS